MTTTSSITRRVLAVPLSLLLLLLAPALSSNALADAQQAVPSSHVVSPSELQQDLATRAADRQAKVTTLENVLSTAKARQALKSTGMNYEEVRRAVPLLSNEQLARLSARAESAQDRFRAGALTNQQLTYIIIALATAVIILVIVKA
jgi:hypothetical protein